MGPPLLLVVTGMPSSGKTTVAEGLARRLRLPLIAKDEIKESLYDSLGAGDVASSAGIGRAAYALIFALARTTLDSGVSVLVEANFFRDQEAAFRALPAHRLVQPASESFPARNASRARSTCATRSGDGCAVTIQITPFPRVRLVGPLPHDLSSETTPRDKRVKIRRAERASYPVRASAPATTSRISCVISAWRARLRESVSRSMRSPAFFDAFRIAVICEARTAAADSSRAR